MLAGHNHELDSRFAGNHIKWKFKAADELCGIPTWQKGFFLCRLLLLGTPFLLVLAHACRCYSFQMSGTAHHPEHCYMMDF